MAVKRLLRKLLVDTLLKRGVSKTQEFIGKKIRHGMTTLGGAMLAHGFLQPDDVHLWEMVIGGAVALGGIILSDMRLYVQEQLK